MDRFDYIITHVLGKFVYTADTLSRAPINDEENESHLQKLTDIYVQENNHVTSSPFYPQSNG